MYTYKEQAHIIHNFISSNKKVIEFNNNAYPSMHL